jgi:hypothetical protein
MRRTGPCGYQHFPRADSAGCAGGVFSTFPLLRFLAQNLRVSNQFDRLSRPVPAQPSFSVASSTAGGQSWCLQFRQCWPVPRLTGCAELARDIRRRQRVTWCHGTLSRGHPGVGHDPDRVTKVSTAQYFATASHPVAPRPNNSDLDLDLDLDLDQINRSVGRLIAYRRRGPRTRGLPGARSIHWEP